MQDDTVIYYSDTSVRKIESTLNSVFTSITQVDEGKID